MFDINTHRYCLVTMGFLQAKNFDTGNPMQQWTIAQSTTLTGIGLHSGQPVALNFLPAPVNHGIVFFRNDLLDPQPIIANYRFVTDTQMSSNISNHAGQRIGTVEHLLSAIAAMGIDNLIVEVNAGEIPIMDGSAMQFVTALHEAGICQQNANKQFIRIVKPVKVTHEDKIAQFTPYQGFSLEFDIEFDHPAILAEHSHVEFDFNRKNFVEQIATARTFGFVKDIEYLKRQNLGMGGSMDNAIVLDEQQVLNPEGLRFADEFVRHKILDAVGDLYLAGHQILAKFYAKKSGHMLNNKLLQAVFADSTNYEIVTICDNVKPVIDYFN